jgi:hypothetical protein
VINIRHYRRFYRQKTSAFAGAGDELGLRGGYRRPNDTLDLHACLILMQRSVEGLHVGGKSALDWYGVRQYPAQPMGCWCSSHEPDLSRSPHVRQAKSPHLFL